MCELPREKGNVNLRDMFSAPRLHRPTTSISIATTRPIAYTHTRTFPRQHPQEQQTATYSHRDQLDPLKGYWCRYMALAYVNSIEKWLQYKSAERDVIVHHPSPLPTPPRTPLLSRFLVPNYSQTTRLHTLHHLLNSFTVCPKLLSIVLASTIA